MIRRSVRVSFGPFPECSQVVVEVDERHGEVCPCEPEDAPVASAEVFEGRVFADAVAAFDVGSFGWAAPRWADGGYDACW